MMDFGLLNSDLEYIIKFIKQFKEIEKAVIFSSRAKGNYNPVSDVDIEIYGEDINFDTLFNVHSLL
jgi:predicted nucleotidyltransferase